MKKYKGFDYDEVHQIDGVGCRKYIGRDSRAFSGTEIFLSTNTGELKNIILEGNVLEVQAPLPKNLMTTRKDREDDE